MEIFRLALEGRGFTGILKIEGLAFNTGIKFNYFDEIIFTFAVIFEHDEKPNRIIRLNIMVNFKLKNLILFLLFLSFLVNKILPPLKTAL